jgi:hypothetical protein
MKNQNDTDCAEEMTVTTGRWSATNPIAISAADFERLTTTVTAVSSGKRSAPGNELKSPPKRRAVASAGPRPSQEESPTLMWDSSRLSATFKNLSAVEKEDFDLLTKVTPVRVEGLHVSLSKRPARAPVLPMTARVAVRAVPPLSTAQPRPAEAKAPQQPVRNYPPRVVADARPRILTKSLDRPKISTVNKDTFIINALSISALFIFVLVERLLIATPAPVPTNASPDLDNTKLHHDIVSVSAGPLPSATASSTSAVPVPTPVTPEPTRVFPASQSIKRVRNKSIIRDTTASASSPRPTKSDQFVSKPSILRVNSRPWSQVFVDGKLVGNTPQIGLELGPGRHTVILLNESLAVSKTFEVNLKPGKVLTKIVNLIE